MTFIDLGKHVCTAVWYVLFTICSTTDEEVAMNNENELPPCMQ